MHTLTNLGPTAPTDDARRTGAVWIAGTGAFLLLAATALFVAVRWDRIPDSGKLAIAGGLTGLFLLGGRALRRTLPATGDVLFHLGAFLVPVDTAAVAMRTAIGWRGQLLLQGMTWLIMFPPLARASGSVVLGWAAVASVPLAVAGVAAVSPVPAPLLLAGGAVAAAVSGRQATAAVWAALAGLAPVLGVAAAWQVGELQGMPGAGVLEELGLAGRASSLAAAVSGIAAGWVLANEARRRRDVGLAALAATSVLGGSIVSWVAADLGVVGAFIGPAALFLLIELGTALARHDPFWGRPARQATAVVEVLAAVVGGWISLAIVLFVPSIEEGFDFLTDAPGWEPELAAALAWAMVAGAWVVAGWRRVADGAPLHAALVAGAAHDRTLLFAALASVAAVAVGTASTVAAGIAVVVVIFLLAFSGERTAHVLVALGAVWAPVTVTASHPALALPLAAAGAGAAAVAASLRWDGAPARQLGAVVIAVAGLASLVLGVSIATPELNPELAWIVYAGCAWAMAFVLDRSNVLLGHVARAATGAAVVGAAFLHPVPGLTVAAVVTIVYAAEAIRLDAPVVALGGSVSVQAVTILAAAAAGLDQAGAALAVAISAIVWTGIAGLVSTWWRVPFVAAAVGATVGALAVAAAAGDSRVFGDVLVISGGLGLAAGIAVRRPVAAHLGAATAILGMAMHLASAGVTASEAYLAPIAVQMVVGGAQVRRRDPSISSWEAYGPAIGLLGGAAFVERLGDGPGWHAVVGGAVGVLAVAAGGWFRLAGPLLLGTALLAVITVHESLAALAGVPTWAWLAAGGATLLMIGIVLERTGQTPTTAGRRLVDVVADRFD